MKRWGKNEIEIINQFYPTSPQSDLTDKINRSWKSITRKAEQIGLSRSRGLNNPVIESLPSWLVGELLSDGCIDKSGRYCHTTKWQEYASYLHSKFQQIGVDISIFPHRYTDKRTRKTYHRYLLRSKVSFKKWRNIWYPEGKKIVPREILIDDQCFKHLFIGDGSVATSCNISSMGFDSNSVDVFIQHLKEFGINVSKHKNNNIGM